VYGYAALHGLLSMGLNLNKRAEALPPIPVTPAASSQPGHQGSADTEPTATAHGDFFQLPLIPPAPAGQECS